MNKGLKGLKNGVGGICFCFNILIHELKLCTNLASSMEGTKFG